MAKTRKKTTHGRNPLPQGEKKEQLTLYIEGKVIQSAGGTQASKEIAVTAIRQEAEKNDSNNSES